MQYERNGNGGNPALTELRGKLSDGLARNRINKTELARRSELGRTTVSEAFQTGGPVPSAHTVEALARALKLPVGELLALQRDADAGGGGKRPVPGRPIEQWEPHALEVHPAGPSSVAAGRDAPGERVLPGYVKRGHDLVLAEAVRDAAAGRSRMVVLVGSSSTGKTRACWEAVQPLADMGWRLWHPFDPTRAEAALDDLHRVAGRTVVWLNEAQHYLGDREAGERIAAVLHGLLTTPERGPVLVLGTLWPEYAARYTAMPSPERGDPYSRVRELLSGRTLTVPDAFDAQALATAAALARDGDRLLADALTRADADGRVTQDLAGAPELLNRYEQASPAARAVLEAAMDARRLGVGLNLPQTFLTDAVADYLTDTDYDQLTEDWAEQAFAELAELVHGKQAPCATPPPGLDDDRPRPPHLPTSRPRRLRDRCSGSPTTSNNTAAPPADRCVRPLPSGTPPSLTSPTRRPGQPHHGSRETAPPAMGPPPPIPRRRPRRHRRPVRPGRDAGGGWGPAGRRVPRPAGRRPRQPFRRPVPSGRDAGGGRGPGKRRAPLPASRRLRYGQRFERSRSQSSLRSAVARRPRSGWHAHAAMAMIHVPLPLDRYLAPLVKTCDGWRPTDLLSLVAFRVARRRARTSVHEVVHPHHFPYVPNVPAHKAA
ncbi:helix-turn-helix transcriptional regulator [Streptomyces sp. TRM 70351]|uniref:helix-turn-helix domain-containing protein n=1 Tax=Streptomyces sp. TRM 70351 TaxID=3116552 RepID=UPI002E7C3DA1|nr:helix-turn-helix transcriptional regulator [Streptomyces sp. TRM 70351]MEE1931224.1 helix-turn-helix transcriptional regulator [Streptomyces sp. TRM 70351]